MGLTNHFKLKRLSDVKQGLNGLQNKFGKNFEYLILSDGGDLPIAIENLRDELLRLRDEVKNHLENSKSKDALRLFRELEKLVSMKDRMSSFSLGDFGRNEPLDFDSEVVKVKMEKAKDVLSGCKHIPEEMRDEIFKCFVILDTPSEVIRLWKPLEEEIRRSGEITVESSHLLSNALRKKEEEHCFPEVEVVPVGILSSEFFEGMTAWGWQLKDPGPGFKHGDVAHRLQWNALMARFEEDKKTGKPWKFTPFELFTKIGDLDRSRDESTDGIWANLMDIAGGRQSLVRESPGNVVSIGTRQQFRGPDEITFTLSKIGELGDSMLGKLVKERRDKRLNEIWNTDGHPNESKTWKAIEKKIVSLKKKMYEIINSNSNDRGTHFIKLFEDNPLYFTESVVEKFVSANKEFYKSDRNEVDVEEFRKTCVQIASDGELFRSPMFIGTDEFMLEYKKRKTPSKKNPNTKYAEHPTEDLLVGGGKDIGMLDMTEEQKMQFVKQLQLSSRVKYGLPTETIDFEQAYSGMLSDPTKLLDELMKAGSFGDAAPKVTLEGIKRAFGDVVEERQDQEAARSKLDKLKEKIQSIKSESLKEFLMNYVYDIAQGSLLSIVN